MRKSLVIAVGMTVAFVAPAALAQDNPPAGGGTTGTAQAGGTVEATPPTPPKVTVAAPAPAAAKEADDGVTDHEKVVGHFAVGYMGVTQLPIGGGSVAGITSSTIDAPVIGMRYWINPRIGLDLGLGIGLYTESRDAQVNPAVNQTVSTDGPAFSGFAFHGGVPIALNTGKHYTFQVVPEANVGIASRTEKFTTPNTPDLKHSGFRLDVGARVGAEIHFGFIGVPELALQASVGLYVSRQVWKNSQDTQPNNISQSVGVTKFGTNVQSDPWALFTNNISALYYF